MKLKTGDGASEGETTDITVFDYFTKHSAYLPWLDVGKPKRPNYLHLERASLVEKSRQKPQDRTRTLTDLIERPFTLLEEEPHSRRQSPVIRVEKMFELIQTKLPNPPDFVLCVLPERKNSDIYAWKNSLLAPEYSSCVPLIKDTPTMVLGMDVSHWSLGRSDIPSVAVVVGSRSWPLISRYRAAVRTQSPKLEMIDALYKPLANGKDDSIIRELLVDFYKTSNGCKPTQIIVFSPSVLPVKPLLPSH
ncbi:hypothetical protein ACLB2K_054648 [Fragaria x ananassa]